MHTGKNFSLEDIQEGKLKDHLAPKDYDLEKRVSILHIYLLFVVFGPFSSLKFTSCVMIFLLFYVP